MKLWFIYLTLLALGACSKELVLDTSFLKSSGLGGTIPSLNGVVLNQKDSHSLISSAYAVTCDTTVYARLYAVQANGSLATQPILSTEVTSNRYEFPKSALPAQTTSKVMYQVVVEGCDEYLSRPVTSFDKKQDVTFASTLVGSATLATLNKPISQVDTAEIKSLIDSLSGTSVLDTYTNLVGTVGLTNQFTATFADVPSKLLESYPAVVVNSYPTIASEGLASTFKVTGIHFDNSYSSAFEWHINGVEQSTSAEWLYTPSGSSSGNSTITLFVGMNDGTNHVDRSKPFYVLTKSLQIMDTIPAIAPDFILAPYTRDGNITVKVVTGNTLESCNSFSYFLITDSLSTPSATDPGFSRTCLNDPEQDEAFSFASTDGVKTISLWVKDSTNNVSAAGTSKTILWDSTLPSATLTGLSPKYAGGATASFNFSAADSGSGMASLELHFSSAGSAFAKVKDLTLGGTSDSMVLPSVDVTDALLKVVAIDNAGNIREVTSAAITIDSAPPTAPTVTLASAAVTNNQTVSLNVTCTGITDVLIGETVTALDTTGWTTCAASMNTVLPNQTNGPHAIKIFARDDVGNVSSATTVNLTYDNTIPTASFTSTPSALSSQSTFNFQFTGSDNLTSTGALTYECSLNGGAYATCSSPSSRTGFTTGSNSFSVRSTDLASNVSNVTTYTWSFDNSQPTITFTDVSSLTPAISNSLALRSVTIDGTNVDSYKYTVIQSGSCSAVDYSGLPEITLVGNTTLSFTPTTDGTYQICAIGKTSFNVWQLASNASSSPVLTIDTNVPTLSSLALSPSQFNTSTTPGVTGTTKVSATVTLHLNSVTCASAAIDTTVAHASTGAFSLTAPALTTDNDYNYYVKATDAAGNSICSSALPYTLDRVAPTISLDSLSGGEVIKGSQTTAIDWTATDLNLTTTPMTIEFSLNGGANWTQIATSLANSGTYSWALPGYNSTTARIRITALDKAGNSKVETSSNFTIDSSAPILTLNTLTGGQVLRGGATQAITWTASDTNTSGNWIALSYSSDSGATWTPIISTTNTGTYSWTVPSVNSNNYRVRVVATDSVGQATTVTSTSNLIIDSTAPVITLTSFTGGEAILGNSYQAITWNATDANFASTPISIELSSNSGSTWTSIAANLPNTGSYSWQANVADASTYRVRVKATDAAGLNTTSASTSNFTVSTQAPKIAQTTLASPYYSNTATSVTFGGACDDGYPIYVTGAETATVTCTSSLWTWTTATQSTDATRNYTFTQTNAVLTLAVTSRWVRDTVAPTLSAVSINNGNANTPAPLVSVAVTTGESGIYVRLANAATAISSCQDIYADNNWQSQTSTTKSYNHVLSSGDGNKKICAWAKDLAGNVTTITPGDGVQDVNMDTINYASGNPPTISSFSVVNDSGGGFQGTSNANQNDPLKITWTVGDIEGLDNAPIILDYSLDGNTWQPIESGYGSLSGNPTTYSDTYYGFSAPASTFFRVRIRVKDLAGNTSAELFSKAFNTSPWSVFAGSTGRGVGGSAKSASIKRATTQLPVFAMNPINSDIWFIDNTFGLKKISAATGIVSLILPHTGALKGITGASGILNPTIHSIYAQVDLIFFDNKGFLYIYQAPASLTANANSGNVYRVNPETLEYTRYLAGGVKNDNTATPSDAFVLSSAGFAFDESNSLYFLASCTPGTAWVRTAGTTSTLVMMKVTQNEDGTPGTVTRVAGNCVRGVPVSGQPATSNPFTNQSDNPWNNNIVVWGNGRYIYYNEGGANSGRTFKIIDGITYTTTVAIRSNSTAHYSPTESLLYVADGTVRAYSVSLSGNGGEVENLTKRLEGEGTLGNCTDDGIPGTDACGTFSSGVMSSSGRFFFVEGVAGLVRLRYLDDNSNIQTIAGTKPFSGDGQAPSLAKGNFSGIYYKKSTELLSSTYPEGLYFLENQGGVFGYFTDSTTNHLWGNQSAKSFSATGTVISKSSTIGNLSNVNYGALSSFTFDRVGQPWIRSNAHGLYYLDSTKTIRSPSTAVISDSSKNWHLAPVGGNPSLYHIGAFGTIQNMTFKDDSKLFLLGVFYDSATGWTDLKAKLRIFDYENSIVKHVMGDQTPASAPQQLTPGSLQNSPLSSCQNANCNILYSQSNDRLYFTENSTKLRYITDPETPANHTLVDVFTAIGTITNFTISPSGKYIMYTMSGRLYCHAVNLVDESAICKNNPANHINLGPPAGLSLITRGPNQFTWKSETILYVSTYTGEIYEYLLFH